MIGAMAINIGVLAFNFIDYWIDPKTFFNDPTLITMYLRHLIREKGIIWLLGDTFEMQFRVVTGTLFMTAILPTVIHLCIVSILLASKVLRSVLKPTIGRVLYAFYESQQGVLTNLAIGIGAMAKLVEAGIKMIW